MVLVELRKLLVSSEMFRWLRHDTMMQAAVLILFVFVTTLITRWAGRRIRNVAKIIRSKGIFTAYSTLVPPASRPAPAVCVAPRQSDDLDRIRSRRESTKQIEKVYRESSRETKRLADKMAKRWLKQIRGKKERVPFAPLYVLLVAAMFLAGIFSQLALAGVLDVGIIIKLMN
jgi:hypothetical protein